MKLHAVLASSAFLLTGGCADVEAPDGCHYHGDELHCDDDENHGLATKMMVYFRPPANTDAEEIVFVWSDPENDGDPIVDPIVLPMSANQWTMDLQIWNELQEPAEDVTVEILEQSDIHQIFFTGSAVTGPATKPNADAILEHGYVDSDANGAPLGLSNTIDTLGVGNGELVITLRHLPTENGESVKGSDLAETVAADGISAIPGSTDIEVRFDVTVVAE